MTKPRDTELARKRRLAKVKRLAKAGKIVIANDAATKVGSVVVRSYTRYKAKTYPESERGVFILQWSRPGVGFGEISLTTQDGKLRAHTEHMSDAFVLDVLAQALRERIDVD